MKCFFCDKKFSTLEFYHPNKSKSLGYFCFENGHQYKYFDDYQDYLSIEKWQCYRLFDSSSSFHATQFFGPLPDLAFQYDRILSDEEVIKEMIRLNNLLIFL